MLHYPVAIWDPGYMESWLYGILARAGGGILAIWNPGYAVVPRTVRTGTPYRYYTMCYIGVGSSNNRSYLGEMLCCRSSYAVVPRTVRTGTPYSSSNNRSYLGEMLCCVSSESDFPCSLVHTYVA
eukprot:SAG11_NODE_154_length_14340_cov_19.803946_7_plen_125_part_00